MDKTQNTSQKSFITDRPVAIFMVFIAAIVFGYFSLSSLPVTLMPELSYPTITVRTVYPGAAPEEVENDVSRRIEEALGVVSGLKKSTSISRAGVSDVVLNFVWGVDSSIVTQEVLERLDRIRLPRESEKPIILHFDPSLDPVMQLSFSGVGKQYRGEEGLRKLRRIAELQVKRFLEPVPGVAAVRVRGGLEEEIHINVDEKKLIRSRLTIKNVIDRVNKENVNMAGGTLNEGGTEYTVRTLNEFKNLDQIRQTIVDTIDGTPIRVEDIATVELSYKDREIITRADGKESVQIDIYKEADANMVALSSQIKSLIGDAKTVVKKKQGRGKQAKSSRAAVSTGSRSADRGARKNSKGGRGRGGRKSSRTLQLAPHLYANENALLEVVSDRSIFIDNAISEVKKTAVLGGLLAVLVLFIFLRSIKSTFIIALSIPISIFMTFTPMYLSDVTLNIMSLGGLALGIGMLVDSSIVVLESIYRCQEEGDSLKDSVIRGTGEVRGAVFASVLTSIAVFFPMVFVDGIAGQAFGDLGIAVVVSLLVSFLVAVTFIPMLASRRGFTQNTDGNTNGNTEEKTHNRRRWPHIHNLSVLLKSVILNSVRQIKSLPTIFLLLLVPVLYIVLRDLIIVVFYLIRFLIAQVFTALFLIFRFLLALLAKILYPLLVVPANYFNRALEGLGVLYRRILVFLLRSVGIVYGIIVCCFILIWVLISNVDAELLPKTFQGEYTVEVSLPIGTPLEETVKSLEPIEKIILANNKGLKNLLVTYGFDITNSQSSSEGEHTAKFHVVLERSDNLRRSEQESVGKIREYFESTPDVEVNIVRPVLFSQTTPLEIEIYGNELPQLKEKTLQVQNILQTLSELEDVESTLKRGAPEIQVVYDRNKILQQGLSIGTIAESVRDMVKGLESTSFNKVDRRVPIIVRLDESYVNKVDQIRNLIVNPRGDHPLPLYAVADLVIGEGPSEVRRINSQRAGVVTANLGDASLSVASEEIYRTLNSQLDWNDGTSFAITGQNEEWNNTKTSLFLALALSVFLVYVIMASQFESFIHPLIIMFSIPLAFLGTLMGLWLLKINISIVVMLGVIMLTGLVVNNAIVLVDYFNTLRRRGIALQEAVIQAGCVRLRPILMTTATTILGLMPMAVGLGDGAEIRTPMAIAVITGLFSSTFLTLLVIPVVLYSVEKITGGQAKVY